MASCFSVGTTLCYRGSNFSTPSASLSLASRTATSLSLNARPKAQISSGPLHSAFTPSSLSLSSASSFSGLSLGLFLSASIGKASEKRRGLVVRAVGEHSLSADGPKAAGSSAQKQTPAAANEPDLVTGLFLSLKSIYS
ncbi:hypothetical protein SASPL_130275 [Salvia splendens]|uniref:Uncharacterized protein n=1 Tax=Salvia splendens TaxID=180675 RepID=A0A8X8X5S7_SALSN|nr:hypothetical protein SASPL_130275 [Salvia splendens]